MPKPLQPSTYTLRTLIDGGFLYVDKPLPLPATNAR